ncbi:MAG: hypothetical protein HN742_15165 [Lentisphaerae bacterium]|jgi:hypothetical protein|nr:hypothetical protein [Lentisphaerota bacterium]MBT4816331.1 hypothetical protein [Lentisphaerota bacterium]MBT5608499.1 hypothetical protein [Lentisphaerota bacterium]MBT7058507.1 hypothetical protein [Lentisphaerota bacterium]MBT7843216.1 hypothetical protein [Lentisphaerota bacterium]
MQSGSPGRAMAGRLAVCASVWVALLQGAISAGAEGMGPTGWSRRALSEGTWIERPLALVEGAKSATEVRAKREGGSPEQIIYTDAVLSGDFSLMAQYRFSGLIGLVRSDGKRGFLGIQSPDAAKHELRIERRGDLVVVELDGKVVPYRKPLADESLTFHFGAVLTSATTGCRIMVLDVEGIALTEADRAQRLTSSLTEFGLALRAFRGSECPVYNVGGKPVGVLRDGKVILVTRFFASVKGHRGPPNLALLVDRRGRLDKIGIIRTPDTIKYVKQVVPTMKALLGQEIEDDKRPVLAVTGATRTARAFSSTVAKTLDSFAPTFAKLTVQEGLALLDGKELPRVGLARPPAK